MTAPGIPALLEPIQERLDAATPGPWEHYGDLGHEVYQPGAPDVNEPGLVAAECPRLADATFIAHAPTDTARLLAAVKAVTEVHEYRSGPYCETGTGISWTGEHCTGCRVEWPCPTVSAVESALRNEA